MAVVDPLFLTILTYMEETEDANPRAAPVAELAEGALCKLDLSWKVAPEVRMCVSCDYGQRY